MARLVGTAEIVTLRIDVSERWLDPAFGRLPQDNLRASYAREVRQAVKDFLKENFPPRVVDHSTRRLEVQLIESEADRSAPSLAAASASPED